MKYPINEAYPAVYEDEHGQEKTVIHNDGRQLKMTIRGVKFSGLILNDFEPADSTAPTTLALFHLHQNMLCGCRMEYQSPIPIVANGKTTAGILTVALHLGVPDHRGGLDSETLALELSYNGQIYRGRGTSGWFEDELLEIQSALPEGVYLKACITCAFSDYSPYGHGIFSCLACFRDNKEAYRKVSGKSEIFRIWDTHTEYVQETYCCPEFERRKPGTGYRG